MRETFAPSPGKDEGVVRVIERRGRVLSPWLGTVQSVGRPALEASLRDKRMFYDDSTRITSFERCMWVSQSLIVCRVRARNI